MHLKTSLNHCYLVVDNNTYAKIKTNDFLKNLFATTYEQASTSEDGSSWSGFYLTGENTYIEIFNPNPSNDEFAKVANAGIALGSDNPGQLEHLQKTHQTTLPGLIVSDFKKKVDEKFVPWFRYMIHKTDRVTDTLCLWMMEYLPAYFDTPDDISRKRYNSKRYTPEKMLKDITKLYMAVDEKGFNEISTFFSHITQPQQPNPDQLHFHFDQFELVVSKTTTPKGIYKIVMSLTSPVKKQEIKIGQSTLRLNKQEAVWQFDVIGH